MENAPLVSVIVPNYNHARFLRRRLDSIFGQTYHNFEVIILDDCSKDESIEIIDDYRNEGAISAVAINHSNSGSAFKQWKKGIELAKGKYVWIAESDDYCDKEFLQTLVDAIEKEGCVLAYCNSVRVDEHGSEMSEDRTESGNIIVKNGIDFIREDVAIGCSIWNASSAIWKKDDARPEIIEKFRICGDKMLWIQLSENGKTAHVDKDLNYFRIHGDSASAAGNTDGTMLKEEKIIYDYLSQKRILNTFSRLKTLGAYHSRIINARFANEGMKDEIFRIWGLENPIKRAFIRALYRILFL